MFLYLVSVANCALHFQLMHSACLQLTSHQSATYTALYFVITPLAKLPRLFAMASGTVDKDADNAMPAKPATKPASQADPTSSQSASNANPTQPANTTNQPSDKPAIDPIASLQSLWTNLPWGGTQTSSRSTAAANPTATNGTSSTQLKPQEWLAGASTMLSGAMQNAVEGANAAVAAAGEAVAKVDRTALEDGLTHLREASDQLVRDVKSGVVALSEDAKRTDASPSAIIASIKTQTQEAMQLFTDTPTAASSEKRNASAPWDVEALPLNEQQYATALRERMLKLVVDAIYSRPRREALFLSGSAAADGFTFDADSEPERAMAVLEADPNVKRLRAGLVPAKLKENDFWAEYFWHVRHTRRLLLAHDGKLPTTNDDVEVFEKPEGAKEEEGDTKKAAASEKSVPRTPEKPKTEDGTEKDWDKEIDEIFDSKGD